MICKALVKVLGIDVAEFPKPRPGEKPFDEVTYWDRESRDKDAVTLLIDREVPSDTYPGEDSQAVLVLQIEQVSRVVKRQDREDPGRTYDSATKQFKARVIAFEKPAASGNGAGSASSAKTAAKTA